MVVLNPSLPSSLLLLFTTLIISVILVVLFLRKRIESKSISDELPPLPELTKIPKHIAVIMDGNRRFGRQNHSDPLQGHWSGGQKLTDFVQWCMADGIEILTVYAFSTENWNRELSEVNALMNIFTKYSATFRAEALGKNIRVKILSTDFSLLPPSVQQAVIELQSATSHCTAFTLNICLSYGGKREILGAVNSLVEEAVKEERERVKGEKEREKQVSEEESKKENEEGTKCPSALSPPLVSLPLPSASLFSTVPSSTSTFIPFPTPSPSPSPPSFPLITESMFEEKLSTQGIPAPDLLIRTSGERRLSNFLLWQLAYSELFFLDQHWPEISHSDLRGVLSQYAQRKRRYGT